MLIDRKDNFYEVGKRYEIHISLADRTMKAFNLKETALYGPLYRINT